MSTLEFKSMKDLLQIHNTLATKPAGAKTFSTKTKLLDRIRSLQATQVVTKKTPSKKPKAAQKKATAKTAGVGELARALLMDKRGLPPALIADLVNREISGATCSAGSVRWYANEMRKKGIEVPRRAEKFGAMLNEEEAAAWLETVRVIRKGGE